MCSAEPDTDTSKSSKKKRTPRKKKSAEGDSSDGGSPKRKRRQKRHRAQSLDLTTDSILPDHDPTLTSMSALTENLPIGKPSSRYAEVIQKHSEARVRERKARSLVKERIKRNEVMGKVGRASMDEGDGEETRNETERERSVSVVPSQTSRAGTEAPRDTPEVDEFAALKDAEMVPQMRIDPTTGDLILDDLGLEVERGGRNEEGTYEVIEEREQDRFFNSATFTKRMRSTRWTAEETAAFHRVSALAHCAYGV